MTIYTKYVNWTTWNFLLTNEIKSIFDNTVGKLIGVRYKLIAYKKSNIVANNFKFISLGTIVGPFKQTKLYEVTLYNSTTHENSLSINEVPLPEFENINFKQEWSLPANSEVNELLSEVFSSDLKAVANTSLQKINSISNFFVLCQQKSEKQASFTKLVLVHFLNNELLSIKELT